MQQSLLQNSWDAANECRPDLIIFHPKAYGGPHFAEKLGVPVMMALPFPLMVPTAEHPHMGFPDWKLGGWYNRMTYGLVRMLMRLSAGKHIRAWRAAHGLPRQQRFDLLHKSDGSDIPVLHGFSKHVVPRPTDWPHTASITGYWFLDSTDEWTPSPELEAFLEEGPPPVYFGFGSMAGRHPERLTNIVVRAVQEARVRGIVATGWGGLQAVRTV